ncbi:IS66 family transposase [Pigmentibacter sp. JX0631]|uniref:IS66 family transposase n=1 Tax=Pigmentibacter sp. JX0631 TaxID=2976982 RepID=UPI002469B4C6|nr:IS66 family transposase [Pigmentibacter sp. JX0631]WGL58847.1 IS66 family transposase [Pigmentibacter sp. JX0631]WGL59050.1 IS66 family transposase [Pigmentibacter sp. JX0631]WGL59342.1 IS66 family transposase [Pigmentibacter sp. JX0631]
MEKNLFEKITANDLLKFNSKQLIEFFENQKKYTEKILNSHNEFIQKHNLILEERDSLKKHNKELLDKIVEVEGQLVLLRRRIFREKSERIVKDKNTSEPSDNIKKNSSKKRAKEIKRLPSERYPEAEIIEEHVEFKELPICNCCGSQMRDSGMTEDSEFLTTEPKDYYIIKQKRHKYRCTKCHGDIKTAPTPKKIIPSSVYSDEMIVDVAMTKYCDLIPIERYSSIAGREGFVDLPPNSLIGTTHKLAEYVELAYNKVKEEILSSNVLHADETPHRMLEGDEKKSWYLWGFSNKQSSYFEIRNTRSGDVASEILGKSKCEYLVSDIYSGYVKSTTEVNKKRENKNIPLIKNIYCNAHSRRKFMEAEKFPESKFFIEQYHEIYRLESDGKKDPQLLQKNRNQMKALFEDMKIIGKKLLQGVSAQSTLAIAINYFLKNYEGLTRFIENIELPIDNNHQERQLRSPVIGRKTWYGTHSKQGAKTASIMFTLVESCKLNGINPREYFSMLVKDIHAGKNVFTPKEFNNIDSG